MRLAGTLALLLLGAIAAGPAGAQTPPGTAATPGIGVPAGLPVSSIATGGTAVTLLPAGWMVPNFTVCDVVNPADATEALYIDLVGTAAVDAPTSLPLAPGQAYRISRQIRSAVTANAATAGHLIVGVCY